MANAYVINADSTEIPDIEYTVKGKVTECYNFDNTYLPDVPLGGSDAHTNFLEGDTITVERSNNGTSWATTNVEGIAGDTSFRILDKYLFTSSKGFSSKNLFPTKSTAFIEAFAVSTAAPLATLLKRFS